MSPMQFNLLAQDGAARRGAPDIRARHGRDPGIHAGGNLWHREGDDAGRSRGHWRRNRARQHVSFVFAARARGDSGASGTAPLHALAPADPDRFWRISSVEPGARCARSRRRARIFARRSTARPYSCPPKSPCAFNVRLAADVAMSFDECTPYPATEDEARDLHGTVHALGAARFRRVLPQRASRNAVWHRSGRHPPRHCGSNRWRRWRRSASPGSRSAAWRSASPRRNANRC